MWFTDQSGHEPHQNPVNRERSWPISPVLEFSPQGKFVSTYFVVEKIDIFTTFVDIFTTFCRIYVDPSTEIT